MDTATKEPKGISLPQLSPFQLFSLSVGIIGIQFAWSMQMAFSSRVLEPLGANPFLFGLIWCAGPITGVVVPPIIGALSDKTWTKIGRRRPYVIIGTLIAALMLFLFPLSTSLGMATLVLWIMNATANAAQAPYRALVPDSVPENQQVMANSFINLAYGAGSIISLGVAPLLLMFHVSMSIVQQFVMTSVIFVLTISYSCLMVKEYKKPAEVDESKKHESLIAMIKKFFTYDREINKLCAIQILIWVGMQSIYIYLMPFVVHNIYGLPDMSTPKYSHLRVASKIMEPIESKINNKTIDEKTLTKLASSANNKEALNKELDEIISKAASSENYGEKEINNIKEIAKNDVEKEVAYKLVILQDGVVKSADNPQKLQIIQGGAAQEYRDFSQFKSLEKIEQQATNTAQIAFVVMNLVSLLLSLPLGYLCCKFSKKLIFTISLSFAAVASLFAPFVHTPTEVIIMCAFIGCTSATILSIPYAMLGDYLPKGEEGIAMGIFNMFIAGPQVVSAVVVSWIISQFPMKMTYGMAHNWSIAFLIASACLFITMFNLQFMKEKKTC